MPYLLFCINTFVPVVNEDSFQTPAFQKTYAALMYSPTPTLEEAQDNSASDSEDDNDVKHQILDVCASHRTIPRRSESQSTESTETPEPESNEADSEPEAKPAAPCLALNGVACIAAG